MNDKNIKIYLKLLELVHCGSTQYALSEYMRHGLDKIRNHEDIMALHGRLYKDLFLSQTGKTSLDSARSSAEKYEAAFKDTGGFYSGINAATMSLLAGYDEDMVHMRAKRMIDLLPPTEDLDGQSKYFIEATRAEAQLLLGDLGVAQKSLQVALDHDPLNFKAHASTLKQFRMIGGHRSEKFDWLVDFQAPIAVHFAGHMFGLKEELKTDLPCLSQSQIDALRIEISELIQLQDIGFGYGALAAGADILIAEAILEESGELHVTLPTYQDLFLKTSVEPYGVSWIERFEACLAQANTVSIISTESAQLDSYLEKKASLASMGAAIRRAESLSVPSAQLLIWDEKSGSVGTASDAKLWDGTDRPRYVINYGESRTQTNPTLSQMHTGYKFTLKVMSSKKQLAFDELTSAISKALDQRQNLNPKIKQILDIEDVGIAKPSSANMAYSLPGSIILTESVANHITVYHFDDYSADFIGTLDTGDNIYALRVKGPAAI